MALAAVGLAVVASSSAGWTLTASGTGAARAGSLGAGSKPTATTSGVVTISVALSWTATAGATGYVVQRTGGLGILGGSCTGTVTTTSCTDSPVVTLQTYTYTVRPTRSGWTGTAGPGTAVTT
jgi:hypothetical protein